MARQIFILIIMWLLVSCETEKDYYNEKDYVKARTDTTIGMRYSTEIYHFRTDTSYNMTKLKYGNQILSKRFYHNDKGHGPYEDYDDKGHVSRKGTKVNGKNHGDYIEFEDSSLVNIRGQYKMGKKTGVQEDYYPTGILFKKVYYDDFGKFLKQEIFDRKEGKLVRTEYEESIHY